MFLNIMLACKHVKQYLGRDVRTRAKRVYKARLRAEERQRNRVMRLAREIRELASRLEAEAKNSELAVVRDFQSARAETLRRFADQCGRIAPLVALPALPKAGGRQLMMVYKAQLVKELKPGTSRQQIADALAGGDDYLDGDTLRKASQRVANQLGPDAFAKGSPLRKLFDQHLAKKP